MIQISSLILLVVFVITIPAIEWWSKDEVTNSGCSFIEQSSYLAYLSQYIRNKGPGRNQGNIEPFSQEEFLNMSKKTVMDLSANIVSKILKQSNVIMRDSKEVEGKLKAIIEDGPGKLQVIADFDSTLTKSHVNGKPTTHSIDVINKVPTLTKEFSAGCNDLFRKYNDLAYSPELPEEQKQETLNQWWAEYVALLTKEYVTLEDIKISTETINTPLRDGCENMFSLLSESKVPVVVVSAGVADVISHTLQKFQLKIFGNFLQVEEKGRITGFKEPYVSVYNKHKIELPVDPARHNVVLMGDSLGDCSMADNVPGTKTVLKIGFFSQQGEAALEKYCNRYDIVLVDDQTMDVPNALFTQILAPHSLQ